jgi:murein DD-endopeptidase MepM/ murein hydrolase activator NlpD
MSIKRRRRGRIIPALVGCFYAGIAVGWLLHAAFTPRRSSSAPAPAATTGEREDPASEGGPVRLAPNPIPDVATIGADPIAELRRRGLILPVNDAEIQAMEGDFAERRGGGSRGHEAVDILADRNTPVRAVEGGTIAKLFYSKAGGTTLYQFDPSENYCYYYAHLESYAPGIREGMTVSQGDIIGYVGTSGNAPPNTPHLHFAIYELTAEKRWWEGRPLDPYLVFRK